VTAATKILQATVGRLTGGRFRIGELIDLVVSDSDQAEDHLKTVFGWYFDRETALVKGTFATAALIIAGLIAAALDGHTPLVAVVIGLVASAFLALVGLWQNLHLEHLHREYLISLRLLRQLKEFETQLSAYARTGEG
jgi:hypothetical protein